jgi:nucleoside-diphosphate-sugar epimerase
MKKLLFPILAQLYDPVKSRVVYDLVISLVVMVMMSAVLVMSGVSLTGWGQVWLGLPILFVTTNTSFGIYSIFKMSHPFTKSFVLALSIGTSAGLVLMTQGNQLLLLAATPFILLLTTLPRWFFNFGPKAFGHLLPGVINRDHQPVLVVGGGGYIGSHVVSQLLEAGFKVRVLDTFSYSPASLDHLKDDPDLEIHVGDVSDLFAMTLALKGVRSVIHLAGIVGDPACAVDDDLTRHINIATTRMLKESLKAFQIPQFIFASSCSVYGFSDQLVNEKSNINPVSLYAQTKVDAEREILQDTFDEFHPTILRFATVFGDSARMRFDLVANLFAAQAYHQGKITVNGGGQWRPFVHVADVASAIVAVVKADQKQVSRQVFNVGNEEHNVTIGELAKTVARVIKKDKNGRKVKVVIDKTVDDHRNYRVSFDKIKKVLGYETKYTLESGIAEMQQQFESGVYHQDYSDPVYSNLEMTKLLQQEFRTEEYQQQRFTAMNSTESVASLAKSFGSDQDSSASVKTPAVFQM